MCTGLEPLLFGQMASASAGIAGTTGLFGSMGAFGLAETAMTLGAFSSLAGGSYAAEAQAAALERDAAIARRNAELEVREIRRDAARVKSSQIAAFGKSGVAMEGTPADVLAETAEESEYQAQLALYAGNLTAGARRAEAKSVRTAESIRGVGTLLTAGSRIGKPYGKSTTGA